MTKRAGEAPAEITADIWDGYANWTDVAIHDPLEALKSKITGAAGWAPNRLSLAARRLLKSLAAERADAALLDFGCGLGRNAALLRPLAARLAGYDLPEMVARLRDPSLAAAAGLYDAVYDDLGALAAAEMVGVVYDSVVFQHILHAPTVARIMDRLLQAPSFNALVTLKNQKVPETLAQRAVRERGWIDVFSEIDEASFKTAQYGVKHDLVVARPPD